MPRPRPGAPPARKDPALTARKILQLPHPALRRRARRVRGIDRAVLRLAYDMVDTLRQADGVGLAANQVGELWRVIVLQLPEEDEARIYINPEITQAEGEREVEEGCLSIPGYRARINRSVWIKFRALDHSAAAVKLKAEDLLAQAIEHEVDHLNGILYIDHMADHQRLIKVDEPGGDDSGDEPDGAAQDGAPDAEHDGGAANGELGGDAPQDAHADGGASDGGDAHPDAHGGDDDAPDADAPPNGLWLPPGASPRETAPANNDDWREAPASMKVK